jgi:asparagine synthase (glutamine-hydrolysing)
MCGIAGIISRKPDGNSLDDKLRCLEAGLRHRGPDDSGIYVSPDRCAGLVHTRLSILDLSPAGHQPMASPDGRYHITFNGEIYNFRELRARLAADGEIFQTNTDTEVLLRMYLRHGVDCLRELAGMFAFAIWDNCEKSCFMARSQLGVKPLYFVLKPESLSFSSEIRALLQAGLTTRRLSPTAVQDFFIFGSVQEPETIIDGVRELPAGCWMHWKDGITRECKYFDVHFQLDPAADIDPVARTRSALEETVRRHFVSDVPVGVFLSGGLDSTALVALARRIGVGHMRTYSISFDSPSLNEGDVAARTARHFGTEHHDWRMTSEEGKTLLSNFVNRLDQPTVDGFNTFCVSKWAHDCGSKVVLSGVGGDEFFGGYPSFHSVPRLFEMGKWSALFHASNNLLGGLIQKFGTSPRERRLGAFLLGTPSIGAAYSTVRGIFTPQEAHLLARRFFSNRQLAAYSPINLNMPTQPTAKDMVSYLEITRYMRNQLLRDSDVMSMAWGLELRVPFVDLRLIKTLSSIPAAIRLQAGKQLLLDAVPEIPDWVARRRKQGFTFPFEQWIRAEWRDVFAQLSLSSPVPLQTWYQKWCLFTLENFISSNKLDAGLISKAT